VVHAWVGQILLNCNVFKGRGRAPYRILETTVVCSARCGSCCWTWPEAVGTSRAVPTAQTPAL
jgi:hypothetical protein